MEFDIEKITINAAFYEIYENVFREDFFEVLAKMRPTRRIHSLRSRKQMVELNLKKANGEELTEDELKLLEKNPGKFQALSDEENDELNAFNLKLGSLTKKHTSRIAYIGSKLYKHEYNGSIADYYNFLATYNSYVFLQEETIKSIWGKINNDQKLPESVKNA